MFSCSFRRNSKFLITILVIFQFYFSFQNFSYGEDKPLEYKLNKEYLKSFLSDFKGVVSSPRDWKKKDFFKLSAILGSSALFFTVDKDIERWFRKNRSSGSEDISHVISPLGHGIFLGSFLTVLYASGEIFDNKRIRKTALLSFESWMISGVIVSAGKFLIGRARPHEEGNSFSFHPFSFRSHFHSFPSGHATSAFAVATVIADQSEKFYIDFLAYNLATLVALSRVHDSKHWASDVFMGAVIGYLVAKKVSALNKSREEEKVKVNFQFSPRRQTITISFIF